jgi:heat shock protein HslJ
MQTRIILVALAIIVSRVLIACATTSPSKGTNTLNKTSWSLSGLHSQSVLPDRQVTIHFENGRVYGTDGCNKYSASFTATHDKFKVDENIVSTKMACPEPAYLQSVIFTYHNYLR